MKGYLDIILTVDALDFYEHNNNDDDDQGQHLSINPCMLVFFR